MKNKFIKFKKIFNQKIIIRNFKKKDLNKEYFSWFQDKHNLKYSRHRNNNYKIDEFLQYYYFHGKDPNSLFLACEIKKDKSVFGTLTVYYNEKKKSVNIGILIGKKKYKGLGLSYMILSLLFDFLLKEKKIKKIIMGTNKNHKAMIKVCKNIGMTKIRNNQMNTSNEVYFFKEQSKT